MLQDGGASFISSYNDSSLVYLSSVRILSESAVFSPRGLDSEEFNFNEEFKPLGPGFQWARSNPWSSGGNYASMGLDLKRHVEEQSTGSPSSTGDNDCLQEPDNKRSRLQDQTQYDTE